MLQITGTVFRVASGYSHGRNVNVGDIIDYETKELGNELTVFDITLFSEPARRSIWVTFDSATAQEYLRDTLDTVSTLEVSNVRVVASDNSGGYLVIDMPDSVWKFL
jgi:hypothetical protein